jgi:zinc/manganese transport system substrate-binding protein
MKTFLAGPLLLICGNAIAALNILACEPEWGALAKELGGDRVSVFVATTALQDPHRIEARPSLIARARSADLVVCTGAELEAGWLPLLLQQSGNAGIQAGRPGYFEAASAVTLIEKPASLDRAQGDVHAAGNPHLHLDPRNVEKVSVALAARLKALDRGSSQFYEEGLQNFLHRWREAMARWEQRAAPLKGVPLVVHHKDLSYLVRWLGMREAGTLEPRPGLPPGSAHLAALLEQIRREPARLVARSAYSDPRSSAWFAGRANVPAVTLPFTVGGSEGAKDLFGLFDDTISRLLAALR